MLMQAEAVDTRLSSPRRLGNKYVDQLHGTDVVTYSHLKHWLLGVLLWGVDHWQQHFQQLFEERLEMLGEFQL